MQADWIVRNPRSPHPEPTATFILTFNIYVCSSRRHPNQDWFSGPCALYIPLPRHCFNCQRYGHSSEKCRRPVLICEQCGGDIAGDHPRDRCHLSASCFHCKEPYNTSSKSCLRYIFEKQLLALKTKEHLTFSEARSRLNLIFPDLSKTYASVTNTSQPNSTTSLDSATRPALDTFRHRTSIPADKQQHSPFLRKVKTSSPNLPPASSVPLSNIPPSDQSPMSPAMIFRTSPLVQRSNPSSSPQYSSSPNYLSIFYTHSAANKPTTVFNFSLSTRVPNISPSQDMSNICNHSTTNVESLGSSKRPLQTGNNSHKPDHHKKARRAEGDSTAGVSTAVDEPGPMVKK